MRMSSPSIPPTMPPGLDESPRMNRNGARPPSAVSASKNTAGKPGTFTAAEPSADTLPGDTLAPANIASEAEGGVISGILPLRSAPGSTRSASRPSSGRASSKTQSFAVETIGIGQSTPCRLWTVIVRAPQLLVPAACPVLFPSPLGLPPSIPAVLRSSSLPHQVWQIMAVSHLTYCDG